MLLENNLSVCRTCLRESTNMKCIFEQITISQQLISIREILTSCTPIQIEKHDGLPQNICSRCIYEINRIFSFRKICVNSDNILRNKLKSLTESQSALGDELKQKFLYQRDYWSEISEEDSVDTDENKELNNFNSEKKIELLSKTVKQINKKKNYKCSHCGKTFYGLAEYGKHTKIHSKSYCCDICNAEFKLKKQLRNHILRLHNLTVTEPEQKHCRLRKKSSVSATGTDKKNNLPKICNVCNKTFRFHSNLERHKLTHNGVKPFLCNVCGHGFSQKSYLKIHSFIHSGERPYKCNVCERSFTAPGTLMNHIRTHTGERPHECKICGKRFPQSGYLSSHIRTHTGEKLVECKICGRKFNQSSRLTVHMRIHSGEKPYKCNLCGRCFAVNGTLKRHIRTHTGERPYVCPNCGQSFAQSSTLSTHMKVHQK